MGVLVGLMKCDWIWLLYDVYKYLFGFQLNGNVINDSLYCVFGIGVIEEFVKFVPFLIILKFTKIINEPIDYIMYASLSALGFAFVENFNYFDDGSINIIHSRALTASIAHMVFSSLVVYGLILAKFRYKKNTFLLGLLFFFIAAFAHGFYDFWLLNEYVAGFSIFTFLCLLTGILVYASLTNNALNHSLTSSDNINLNTSKKVIYTEMTFYFSLFSLYIPSFYYIFSTIFSLLNWHF